jgi:hypothetical protein
MSRTVSLTQRSRRLLVLGAALAAFVLASLNGAVAYFGNTEVFPLSPLHLDAKVNALQLYAIHRPRCLLLGHPPLLALVERAERKHRLPPGLLMAILLTESAGEPHRISPTGAMGVAQLISGTARQLEVRDPYDSEAAVEGGAHYLQDLLAQFHDVRLAVAAYNAGPGNVVNRSIPHNGETEYYVPRVMARYAQLAPSQLRDYAPTAQGINRLDTAHHAHAPARARPRLSNRK